MKVVIAGGTGFLGQPLARALIEDGRDVVVLTRGGSNSNLQREVPPGVRFVTWNPGGNDSAWAAEVAGAVLVNLAGESIGARRWSVAQKQRILESRLLATRTLAAAARTASPSPLAFVTGSAVGYYGPLHDEIVREDHPAGGDFLATVCRQWESEAIKGTGDTTRVACIRTGLVLEKDGGALPRMLTPFQIGLGGRIGSGRQYWPWIHRADWIQLVRWAIDTPAVTGPINATAPHPVTNAEFTKALAAALHRPALMPAPAFALRILLGEMADGLLLSGQNAVPAKALRMGFTFNYPELAPALTAIFNHSGNMKPDSRL